MPWVYVKSDERWLRRIGCDLLVSAYVPELGCWCAVEILEIVGRLRVTGYGSPS